MKDCTRTQARKKYIKRKELNFADTIKKQESEWHAGRLGNHLTATSAVLARTARGCSGRKLRRDGGRKPSE